MKLSRWVALAVVFCLTAEVVMADTPRTAAYLQNALRDNQATGAIAPQVFRDFAVSTLYTTDAGTNVASLNLPQTFNGAQHGIINSPAISGSTFTPNFDSAQNFTLTLVHASCPCTIANPSTTLVPGQSGMLAVVQSATGSDTVTWGTEYKFSGGAPPVLSTGASGEDFLPYYVFSASQIIVGSGTLNAQ